MLDMYLDESTEDDTDGFNVLRWWKMNFPRSQVLSHMAHDILVVLISTVASESAFSSGGRVLDPCRSLLTPKLDEALVCTQDWLREKSQSVSVEDDLDNLDRIEKGGCGWMNGMGRKEKQCIFPVASSNLGTYSITTL